jgi:thioredoxin 1
MSEFIVTESNFENEVLKSSLPVLVDFWAPWCGPCKMIAPVVDELARDYAGKIKVGKLNTDENLNLASRYQITSIPCLLVFKNSKPIEKIIGFRSKNDIKKILDNLI